MYCVQDRNYCGFCNNAYLPNNYPNHLKSQGHNNNVLRGHCTNSAKVKTHSIKKWMKKELVNNITNETIYQLQYYKNLFLAHKKI